MDIVQAFAAQYAGVLVTLIQCLVIAGKVSAGVLVAALVWWEGEKYQVWGGTE